MTFKVGDKIQWDPKQRDFHYEGWCKDRGIKPDEIFIINSYKNKNEMRVSTLHGYDPFGYHVSSCFFRLYKFPPMSITEYFDE